MEFGTFKEGIHTAESQDLFAFVRDCTEPDAVFLFHAPRILALYTGRDAGIYREPATDDELWDYLDFIGADYLVSGIYDPAILPGFIDRNPYRLQQVYTNRDFTVYRLQGGQVIEGS
jgi:hypothetical protein